MPELASQYEIHPTMLNEWKSKLLEEASQLLGVSRSSYYYQPQEISDEELIRLRLLDEKISGQDS